jgi:MFS family permease
MTMSMQLVQPRLRGAASKTNFIGMDSGYLIGPMIAGVLITAVQNATDSAVTGYATMYRVMIIPTVIALVIFLATKKKLLARLRSDDDADTQQ